MMSLNSNMPIKSCSSLSGILTARFAACSFTTCLICHHVFVHVASHVTPMYQQVHITGVTAEMQVWLVDLHGMNLHTALAARCRQTSVVDRQTYCLDRQTSFVDRQTYCLDRQTEVKEWQCRASPQAVQYQPIHHPEDPQHQQGSPEE